MAAAVVLLLFAPLFEDATAQAGLARTRGDRFTFADIDRDGDPDLIVSGRRLYLNERGRFAEKKGALPGSRGGSAACADLDGDGRLDVVTLRGDLFLQRPDGTFRRLALDFPERQASFGLGDVDGDGKPDILTGGGELWKDDRSHPYPRRLLLNRGGGRFEDATERYGFAAIRYGRSVVFCDFDDDGDQDVFFGNYRLKPNELWVNGGESLADEAPMRGCRGVARTYQNSGPCYGHTMAASWADLDSDGWMDLWVSNLVHKYVGTYQGAFDARGEICDDSNLYENEGPPGFRFADRRADSGIALKPKGPQGVYRGDELWSNCACADFDNDGYVDVFVMQVYKLPYAHSLLFRNRGGFGFERVDPGFAAFDGYGAAWADVDGDGRMDLVTGGRPGGTGAPKELRLWRNTTTGGGWIAFRFERPVLGATVRVITKSRVHARLAEATMGSHAQANSDILHVGLGDEPVDEVVVTWPDGTLQLLERARAGKVHVIRRKVWKRPPAVRIEHSAGKLICRPRVPGARYHWDLDDDFRTDEITRKPEIGVQAPRATRVCVRVFSGAKGIRARLARTP